MRGNASGQALVEQALVLPLLVAVLLGLVQLALLQHAAIACDVAAFQAARAGIVYQADPARMTEAARLALLPVLGRTDGPDAWAATRGRAAKASAAAEDAAFPLLSVERLAPGPDAFDDPALTRHLDGRQLDFDDRRPAARAHTVLTVRVRFLCPLRIPFADGLLQSAWLSARRLSGRGGWQVEAVRHWRARGRRVLPLESEWTLRMQSNPVRADRSEEG